MSKGSFAGVVREFADEVAAAFQFLVAETGTEPPEFRWAVVPVAAFASHGIRYRVMLDTDEKALLMRIDVVSGQKRLVAELEDLVHAAGLGSPN